MIAGLHDCDDCKYRALTANESPCRDCYDDGVNDQWESAEESDNNA